MSKPKYAVLLEDNRFALEKEVNARLADGFELAGGLSVVVAPDGEWMYVQAVIKQDIKK